MKTTETYARAPHCHCCHCFCYYSPGYSAFTKHMLCSRLRSSIGAGAWERKKWTKSLLPWNFPSVGKRLRIYMQTREILESGEYYESNRKSLSELKLQCQKEPVSYGREGSGKILQTERRASTEAMVQACQAKVKVERVCPEHSGQGHRRGTE